MASTQPDENDKAIAGILPADPTEGCDVMVPGPRVLTVQEILENSRQRATQPRSHKTLTTGNWKLDHATGGLRPGFVWVFGAETNWGKSSWLVMLADENLKAGRRVLIVSSEDDQAIYGDRLMARRAKVDARRLRDGKLQDDEVRRVTNVVAKAEPLPVFLDARGNTAEEATEHMRRIIANYGIDLVLVDYLQEFRSGVRQQDRRNEVAQVASMIRSTIKRGNAAGVIFSQITITEGKKRPDKHSIRESRDVSNGAEAVILGCNVLDTDGKITERQLFVDKAKDGPKGYTLTLDWNATSACFETQKDPDAELSEQVHAGLDDMFGDN